MPCACLHNYERISGTAINLIPSSSVAIFFSLEIVAVKQTVSSVILESLLERNTNAESSRYKTERSVKSTVPVLAKHLYSQ